VSTDQKEKMRRLVAALFAGGLLGRVAPRTALAQEQVQSAEPEKKKEVPPELIAELKELAEKNGDLVEHFGCPECSKEILLEPCGREFINCGICMSYLGDEACSWYMQKMQECFQVNAEELAKRREFYEAKIAEQEAKATAAQPQE
jgi:hypothetical protein